MTVDRREGRKDAESHDGNLYVVKKAEHIVIYRTSEDFSVILWNTDMNHLYFFTRTKSYTHTRNVS